MADINNSLGQIGSSSINQDNIDIVKNISLPRIDLLTKTDIVDAINNLPIFLVNEIQSLWITGTTLPNEDDNIVSVTLKYKVLNKGKGIYGVGGTPITYNDLYLVEVDNPTLGEDDIFNPLQDLQSVLTVGPVAVDLPIILRDSDDLFETRINSYFLDISGPEGYARIDVSIEPGFETRNEDSTLFGYLNPGTAKVNKSGGGINRGVLFTSDYNSDLLTENFSGIVFEEYVDFRKTVLSAKEITGTNKELVFNLPNKLEGEYTLATLDDIVGGGVTSVSGTADRITSTGGATPVIDIASTYVGQSSITTLGTIGTGIWQGTAITDTYISSATNWNTAYNNRITSLTTTGTSGAATLISNTLNIPNYTLAGLGGTTLAAVNAQNLSVFASTTSAQLASILSNETGTGLVVFNNSPTLINPIVGTQLSSDNSTKGASTAYVTAKRFSTYEFKASAFSPADATTYYFCNINNVAPQTSTGFYIVATSDATTIKWSCVIRVTSVLASSETSTLVLRNVTTGNSVTLSTSIVSTANQNNHFGTASLVINEGDLLELQYQGTTWVTNPTNQYLYSIINTFK